MKRWKVGTLTCGLLFITLGVLLLIYQTNKTSALNLIFTWWPIILIFLGLEVLISTQIASRYEYKIQYDGVSIFLIIIVLLFSLGIFSAKHVLGNHFSFNAFNDFSYKNESKFHKNITITPKDKLTLENSMGNIIVEKSNGTSIELDADITVSNNDENYAKTISENAVKVSEGSDINITSDFSNNDSTAKIKSIDYRLKIPQKMNVELQNEFGKIETRNLQGELKVENKNGNITVSNNSGNLVVQNSFGSIDVQGIDGNVSSTNKNGSMSLKKINGNVKAEDNFGSVTVSNINGNLDTNCSNGSMNLDNISGYVTASNKFGSIELTNATGAINLSSSNGNITFDNKNLLSENVKLESKMGSITLKVPKAQQGHFNINSSFGSISNDFNLNVKEVNHREKTIDQKIGNSSPEINIKTDNGRIQLTGK